MLITKIQKVILGLTLLVTLLLPQFAYLLNSCILISMEVIVTLCLIVLLKLGKVTPKNTKGVEEAPVRSSFKRTMWIFTAGGFGLWIIVDIVFHICQIVWVDFIHYNPYRSQSQALYLIALSPNYALFYTILISELSLIVGTIVAMVSYRILGRVPFYSLFIMFPLCLCALCIQRSVPLAELNYQDIFQLSVRQLPVLIGCWWWSNSTPK